MKETGILYSTDMIKVILDGRKTQTRRTLGLEKINENPDDWHLSACFLDGKARFSNDKTGEDITIKCPYGGVGDLLYARETWMFDGGRSSEFIKYKADDPDYASRTASESFKLAWRPSIHMPKWAARIWQEITGLSAERLQSITEEDALAEAPPVYGGWFETWKGCFKVEWNSLHAEMGYLWESNKWVWVIETRRINEKESGYE